MTVNRDVEVHENYRKLRRVKRPLGYEPGPEVEAMLLSLGGSRCYGQATALMLRAGRFAVDHNIEGMLAVGHLLALRSPGSNNRTLWRHVGLLVRCGALELQADGSYALAHFLEHNYSREERAIYRAIKLADGAERQRRYERRRKGAVDLESTSSRPGEGEQNAQDSQNTEQSPAPDAERTRSGNPVDSSSFSQPQSNQQPADGDTENASPVPTKHVPSKKTQSAGKAAPKTSQEDEDWAAHLAKYGVNLSECGDQAVVSETPAATADDSAIADSPSDPPSGEAAGEVRNYKPARMPNQPSTACNRFDCEKALKAISGDPDRELVDRLFKIMGGLKALTVEVEYAVGGYRRQLAKKRRKEPIRHPVNYLAGIIIEQRRHWLRQLEEDGWCDFPGSLAGLGEPEDWVLTIPGLSRRAKTAHQQRFAGLRPAAGERTAA